MKTVNTYTANIYVGLKPGYEKDFTFIQEYKAYGLATSICQNYCNTVGLCVTLTGTNFIYSNGNEPGVIIGLINYPRFPSSPEVIRLHAVALASRLMSELKQNRVSIVFPDETVMLQDES